MSIVLEHLKMIRENVLVNPHSVNPSSQMSTKLGKSARMSVLRFFLDAPEEEYDVIFSSNASNALMIVGEHHSFGKGGEYLLTEDNHNSVNGTYPVDKDLFQSTITRKLNGKSRLFAYPAQSNFCGVLHPLEWVKIARQNGWDVLRTRLLCICANKKSS
eukprot:gene16238-22099_t